MKIKSLLITIIAIIMSLFIITGCEDNSATNNSNNNSTSQTDEDIVYVTTGDEKFKLNSKAKLYEMNYLENYVDFHTDRMGDLEIMNYFKAGELVFEIRMYYEAEHSTEEIKALNAEQYEEKTKEINGIAYTYYEYELEDGTPAHFYLYEYNGRPYSIIFYLGKTAGDIEDVFMNHVSFGE